ncbi:hypothetical protein NPIL_83361, partial [Nephila pilipes]
EAIYFMMEHDKVEYELPVRMDEIIPDTISLFTPNIGRAITNCCMEENALDFHPGGEFHLDELSHLSGIQEGVQALYSRCHDYRDFINIRQASFVFNTSHRCPRSSLSESAED